MTGNRIGTEQATPVLSKPCFSLHAWKQNQCLDFGEFAFNIENKNFEILVFKEQIKIKLEIIEYEIKDIIFDKPINP